MVEFNREERVIRVKIAYYGPAVGGKTTNLKVLYDRANAKRRGDFVSVNSQQDRTILCDLLPIKTGGFKGHDLRFQLAAVPGQAMYAPARRVVLRGSDGVVFVANSATDRWHENLQSFREMQGHLLAQQIDPMKIPLVFQYNKRDLPEVMEIEALERGINSRRVAHLPAVAVRGEGVLETFGTIVRLTLEDLAKACAKEGVRTVEPDSEGFVVRVALKEGRHQAVHLREFKRADGVKLVQVYTVCGKADEASYAWALRANMKLIQGAVALAKQGDDERFVLTMTFLAGEVTKPEIKAAIKEAAYYGDWIEQKVTGQDEF